MSRRACPDLEASQVLSCGKLALLADALRDVRQASDTCIVACLTNFITSASGTSAASIRAEEVLMEVQTLVSNACQEHPERMYLVCPPMYRSAPLWYRDGMPEILKKFSAVFGKDQARVANLLLMPSFPTPSFEEDGVHLTPISGLEYLYHLFDDARNVISRQTLSTSGKCDVGSESTRVLEDRMMAIEQDHRRLCKDVEWKTAVYAERDDFQENVRNEVYFMITGLSRISDLRGKEWMERAIRDVSGVIDILLGKSYPVIVVHNATGRNRDAEVRYSVRMEYASQSQEIRSKFGSFFAGGKDRRPEALKSISISNKVTPGTQIRIMIMKLLGKRYEASNPGSKVKVVGYESRPMIRITPAEDASDRRVKNFTYIEAIKKLPTGTLASADLRQIVSKARVHFSGRLRSTFVVLSDDEPRDTVRSGRAALPAPAASSAAPDDEAQGDALDGREEGIERVEEVLHVSRKRPGSVPVLPSGQRARR